jgi:hypothetical protein
MEIFYAVCSGLATLCVVIVTVFLIVLGINLNKTVKKFENVADSAKDKIDSTKEMFNMMHSLSESSKSAWLKVAGLGLGLLVAARRKRKSHKDEDED